MRISLRDQDTKKLQNLHFTDHTKQDKQVKALRLDQSSIIWMNHFKQYFQTSLSKLLTNIWQNSKEVPPWGNTWKWNLRNVDLNGVFDAVVPLAICTTLICILVGRKTLKLISGRENVVMQLSVKMKGIYCTLFFHNSPALLDKPFEDGICAIITVGSNRKKIPKLIVKSKYPFYLRMFFDLIDVALVNSHTIYTKRGNKISLLNLKLLWQNLWLVDTVMVRDCFLLVSQANKNFINHPSPEKSQPTCLSFRRRDWDAIIARMKAQITKHLCLVSHVACNYAWLKTGTAFWIIICSFHHDYISY